MSPWWRWNTNLWHKCQFFNFEGVAENRGLGLHPLTNVFSHLLCEIAPNKGTSFVVQLLVFTPNINVTFTRWVFTSKCFCWAIIAFFVYIPYKEKDKASGYKSWGYAWQSIKPKAISTFPLYRSELMLKRPKEWVKCKLASGRF